MLTGTMDGEEIQMQRDRIYAELAGDLRQVTEERNDLAKKLEIVYGSRSWTLTAPLRKLATAGRKRIRGIEPNAEAQSPRPSGDLPPGELRARVTGSEDEHWFRSSGAMALEDIGAALSTTGRSIADFDRIYDFGCGCGRISLPLADLAPNACLTATDADPEATAWLRERLTSGNVAANGDLPPLSFTDDSFDLIIGWSVMTHLPEDYQDAWLAELARVLAPGGTMLLTVHGPTHFDVVDAPADDPNRTALHEEGIVYFENYGPDSPFAPYYQTTYHHPTYVREHWSQWLTVVDILPGAARPTHDMVIVSTH
jgi:SAM-dependent methyltransferase